MRAVRLGAASRRDNQRGGERHRWPVEERGRRRGMSETRKSGRLAAAFSGMRRVSQEINTTLDLERILDVVLDSSMRLSGADCGAVLLREAEDSAFDLQVAAGYDEGERATIGETLQEPLTHPVVGEVLRTEEALRVSDPTAELGMEPWFTSEARAMVVVPVFYAQMLTGLMVLESEEREGFDRPLIQFLEGLADQAAIAIGNARRYQEQLERGDLLRKRAEQLASVLEVARALRSDRPLENILEEVAYGIQESVGFDLVLISVVEGDPPVQRRVAAAGIPIPEFERIRDVQQPWSLVERLMEDRFRISQSFYIPAERRPAWFDQLDTYAAVGDDEPGGADDVRKPGRWHPRDMLIVPLTGPGGDVKGVVSLDQPRDGQVPDRSTVEAAEVFAAQAALAIENAQMVEMLQRRADVLSLFNEISQSATAKLALDEVLDDVVETAPRLLPCDHSSIFLLDADEGPYTLQAVHGSAFREEAALSFLRGQGLVGEVAETGLPLTVDDMDQRRGLLLAFDVTMRTAALTPLTVGDQVVGVLCVARAAPDDFSTAEVAMLSALADQVSVAVDNARLFEEEQQQSQRLSLLAETARIAATTFDAKDLLRSLADAIYSKFEYPLVEIYHRSPGEDKLVRVGLRHSTSPLADRQYRFPMDQGIIGYVARTGRSYLTSDVTDDPYFRPPNTDEMTIRAELCVPILEDGRVIGVIDVESDRQDELGEEDLSMLEAVADTAAIGLRNVRLHRETQRRVKELTLINRLSVGFGAALDLDALINQTLEGLQELMSCERTAFFTIHQEIREWEQTHERLAKDLSPAIQSAYPFELIPVETDTLKAKEPFAVFDVRRDPRVSESQELYEALGMRSFILLPVSIGDELYGALGVGYSRELHAWRSEEIHLLQGVVHQLELALENVHLFEEAQLRAEELAAALARLEELDRLKSEFIQNVSHELRSPLALILGYADLLDSGELGELKPEQEVPISVIARRARMLSNLVRDITVILEAEVNPPEPEPIYLDKLASAVAEDFQLAIEQSDLTLRTEIEPGQPPTKVSPTYMRRVLDNLLSNAVKFTPEGGTITLRVQNEDDHVLLEVQDTGIGIPEEKLDRIFDRFYQVDGSARRRYGGVGLGLALVKEITQAYGGSVTVESQIGHGSTFRLSFPVSEEKRTATSE